MSGPIKAQDVAKAKSASIPEEVFTAFNELIVKDWNGYSATVYQDSVVKLALEKLTAAGQPIHRAQLFNSGWLDIEDSYRSTGWIVHYDKPGYNESYEAHFIFKKSSKSS